VNIIVDSKKDLVDNAGYDEIVIEDFYDLFVDNVKKLENLPKLFGDQTGEGGINDYTQFVH